MNITIFGANSSIGKYLIDLFINDNHKVTAFIDKPGSIKLPSKNLEIIVGHTYDKFLVNKAIQNSDIVINAFRPDFKILKNTNYYANNISNKTIIEEMIKANKKRFITISRLINNKNTGKSNPLISISLNNILYKCYKKDFLDTFALLNESNLDWTIVKIIRTAPSRKKGEYLISPNDKIGSFVSNYNIAHFIYNISINNLFINESPIISNK
ncbi:MAG: NAD(P)H-binding protein [Intestinibacter bartlettii]|uniref:NAD(P)-dependent oxidoreductase n=1 Tax=Intestinibacter bartlettii TaxID=261299 RepID=UPI0026F0C880|nr:NAD(P)H-binding protein [Intestinibacter bartlettii]MDO5009675.1 NAD(P)H-binding protein [Intestinibacter bartlettii]